MTTWDRVVELQRKFAANEHTCRDHCPTHGAVQCACLRRCRPCEDPTPPLYSDRCSRHGNVEQPGPCGDCKDVREAAKGRPLSLVTDSFDRPAWCGQCNEFTRLIDSEDDSTPSRRCRVCHPLAKEAS